MVFRLDWFLERYDQEVRRQLKGGKRPKLRRPTSVGKPDGVQCADFHPECRNWADAVRRHARKCTPTSATVVCTGTALRGRGEGGPAACSGAGHAFVRGGREERFLARDPGHSSRRGGAGVRLHRNRALPQHVTHSDANACAHIGNAAGRAA